MWWLVAGCEPGSLPGFDPAERWGALDDWEPVVAADPVEPYVYQATTRISPVRADIVVRASDDGGDTWGPDRVVSDGRDTYDPQLAVAADTGCVYATMLGGASGWDTLLRRSCDHGDTWSDPVSIAPGYNTDHGSLAVSPDGQDVYVAFNGGPPSTDVFGEGWVSASHDAGDTFDPVFVDGDGQTVYWFEYAVGIDPDGVVYVANGVYSETYRGPADLVVWRSADRGLTWQSLTVATSQEPAGCRWAAGCTYGFFAAEASLAVDRAGELLVAWSAADRPDGPNRLWASSSPGGDRWRDFDPPVALTAGVGEANFPTAAAGPDAGDFRIAWQEDLDPDHPGTFRTRYQQRLGRAWLPAPVDLSEVHRFPYGDYGGLSVDGDGVAHAIWGEGPSWNGPGGTWFTRGG